MPIVKKLYQLSAPSNYEEAGLVYNDTIDNIKLAHHILSEVAKRSPDGVEDSHGVVATICSRIVKQKPNKVIVVHENKDYTMPILIRDKK